MNKIIRKLFVISAIFAPIALQMAYFTANSVCFFLSYQPDEPASLREMRSERAQKD